MKKIRVKVRLVLVLVAIGMNSMELHADELLTRKQTFVPDEIRQQWVNERNGHYGLIEVHGALLSSPCILRASEITLPLQDNAAQKRLDLELTGCGYGDVLDGKTTLSGGTSASISNNMLLVVPSKNLQQSITLIQDKNRLLVKGGNGTISLYLSELPKMFLAPTGSISVRNKPLNLLLQLRLDYE